MPNITSDGTVFDYYGATIRPAGTSGNRTDAPNTITFFFRAFFDIINEHPDLNYNRNSWAARDEVSRELENNWYMEIEDKDSNGDNTGQFTKYTLTAPPGQGGTTYIWFYTEPAFTRGNLNTLTGNRGYKVKFYTTRIIY